MPQPAEASPMQAVKKLVMRPLKVFTRSGDSTAVDDAKAGNQDLRDGRAVGRISPFNTRVGGGE